MPHAACDKVVTTSRAAGTRDREIKTFAGRSVVRSMVAIATRWRRECRRDRSGRL